MKKGEQEMKKIEPLDVRHARELARLVEKKEEKVLSPLEEQIEKLDDWGGLIWKSDVLEVIQSQQPPETEELHDLMKKRPPLCGRQCKAHWNDWESFLKIFEPKFEAFLNRYKMAMESKDLAYKTMEKAYLDLAKKEAKLQQHIKKFPSLTELHASFPNENLLVWRAKIIEWQKKLEALE